MLNGEDGEWLGWKEEGPSALSAETKSRPTVSQRHCDSSLSLAVSTARQLERNNCRHRVIPDISHRRGLRDIGVPRTLKESPSFLHLPESPYLPLYLYPVKRFVSSHCFTHNFSDRRTKKTYYGSHRSSVKQHPHHRLWHMGLIHSPLARTQRLQKCHSPRPIPGTISHLSW